jgi:hypothetical protein
MKLAPLGSYRLSKEYNNKFWMNVLIMGMLFISILSALSSTVADPDLWGYLAFGRLFWESGRFPYHDVYSYVPTLNPWIYHEWLTGVIFYPLYKETGSLGLQCIKYLIGMMTVVLIYLTARQRGADLIGAAVALFITTGFLRIGYSPVRAQVFTYCFFALTLYLLEQVRRTGRWHVLFIIPIIMIFWCNLHGGFVSGSGLITLYAFGEAVERHRFWPYVGILLLSVMITFFNPYGLKYWAYIFQAITMSRQEISEWVSVFHISTPESLVELIYYSLIIFIFLLLIWWGKWREITASLILGITLYLGLSHTRHMVFFLIVAGSYMPVLLTPYIQRVISWPWVIDLMHRLGRKIPVFLALLFISYGAYNFLSSTPWVLRIPSQPWADKKGVYYPVAAINFIKIHRLSGNLLIFYDWGEYALWSLYPQCRVALDGRYETVYPDSVAKEYFDFSFGRDNWERFLNHYPPDMILIQAPSKIHSLIQKEPDWRQVFTDSGSALFLHQNRQ